MIIRIAIPLLLIATTYTICVAGFLIANQTRQVEKEILAAKAIYNANRVANRPARVRTEIFKAISERAKALSYEDQKRVVSLVMHYGAKNGHDPLLLLAMIEIESGFRRSVVSHKGAVGLMQVRPFVARGLAKELNMSPDEAARLGDLDINVKIGSYYLAKMVKRFGSIALALEAYNRGPTKVRKRLNNGSRISGRYTRKVMRSHKKIKAMVGNSA